jgi:hypothetical protein
MRPKIDVTERVKKLGIWKGREQRPNKKVVNYKVL